MPYHSTLRGEGFTFADLRDLFAKANEDEIRRPARRHRRGQ